MFAASDLGCPLRYQGAARLGKLGDRLQEAKTRLHRLKSSPVDLDVKAQVIPTSVYTVAFHGAELFPLGQQHTRSTRYHVAEALVGASESMSSVLVTLCASKYVRDPELHIILQASSAAIDDSCYLVSVIPNSLFSVLSLVAQYAPRPNTSKGPASTLKTYLVRLGWTFRSAGQIRAAAFVTLDFLTCPWKTWVWFAGRAWQDRLLTLRSHRKSLLNFPNVDQRLTKQVLAQFTASERRLLLRETSGTFQIRSQQAIWDDQISPECPWCGQEDAKFHRFFICTQEDTLLPDLPVIFESHQDEFRFTFQFALQERQPDWNLLEHLRQWVQPDSPQHVYTDGCCLNPTLPTLRHAGFSVVLDSRHSDAERCWHAQRYKETGCTPVTFHVVLQELCPQAQDIHHAELRALIRAQEFFAHVVIYVDSSSAVQLLPLMKRCFTSTHILNCGCACSSSQ